jgi:hypothetical protein
VGADGLGLRSGCDEMSELRRDALERDEKRLAELGRRTVEMYALGHIFTERLEVRGGRGRGTGWRGCACQEVLCTGGMQRINAVQTHHLWLFDGSHQHMLSRTMLLLSLSQHSMPKCCQTCEQQAMPVPNLFVLLCFLDVPPVVCACSVRTATTRRRSA